MKKDNDYKSISFDNEFKMIAINRMYLKMNLMNFNGKTSPMEIENTIYVSDGKVLSEKEKIFYECSRIRRFITINRDNLKDIFYKDIYRRLAIILLKIGDKDFDFNDDKTIIELKKDIIEIELLLGMKVSFYSVVDSMKSDLEKKYVIKK